MATVIEQPNDITTDFSDLALGWSRFGNIALSHDGSRAVFERLNGSSAAYAFPLAAADGAGFVEASVNEDFAMVVDCATDVAHTSSTTQWVGVSLRAGAETQWIYPDHAAGTLVSARDSGGGPTFETVASLPTSASHRYEIHLRWDSFFGVVVRVRAYEDREDVEGWLEPALPLATSLSSAPKRAGISMCAPSGVTDPELYIYSLRLLFPSTQARRWFALADTPGQIGSVDLLLNRKSRATSPAHWSRCDYAMTDYAKSLTDSTPIAGLGAQYSTNELVRYRTQLEQITGLVLDHAWFGTPRCAVTGQKLYSELGPTIVTASDVSGVFGTKAFSFTETNDHSFAAFDSSVAEIPDDKSWLVMFVASPTDIPAADVPLCGKQDLFQIAPTPRNGWMLWFNTGDVMLDLADTVGGSNTVSVAKTYSAGSFLAGCARINRSTNLAEIAHDTATSGTINVAGLSFLVPTTPLRLGDARINRSQTAPSARLHLLAFATGPQAESVNLQTLAASLLAAAT